MFIILEISPLAVSSFAKNFSYYLGCLLGVFMVSFAVQKLLSLLGSVYLFLFYFNYSRRWIFKNPSIYVRECSACFDLGVLQSGFIFRSLINFEFIFVCSFSECSNLTCIFFFFAPCVANGSFQTRELQLMAYITVTAIHDPSCICDLHHSSWQCHSLNPLSKAMN